MHKCNGNGHSLCNKYPKYACKSHLAMQYLSSGCQAMTVSKSNFISAFCGHWSSLEFLTPQLVECQILRVHIVI